MSPLAALRRLDTPRRRRAARWLLPPLLLLALAGHIHWWYWPRVHAAVPDPASPLGHWLLAGGDLAASRPMAVWLPYPHQNLAVLHRRAGLEAKALAAAGRLAGLPEPRLPSFGSMALPPSSALAIVSDVEGDRFALAAEVYPLFALFSKIAGRVAGNTYLGGGELVVDGRRLVVAWHGSLWTVSSPEPLDPGWLTPPAEPPASLDDLGPSLLVLRVDRPLEVAPAGIYSLHFDPAARDFELRSREPLAPALAARNPDLHSQHAYLLAYAGAVKAAETGQGLAFFSHDDPGSKDFPRVAIFAEGGERRWELPAEGLLEFTGRKPLELDEEGWQIVTFEEESLRGGRTMLAEIHGMAKPSPAGHLVLGLWLDLAPAAAEVSRIGRMLDQAPWVPHRKAQRWRDIERVLGAFAGRFERLSLVVANQPDALVLRLEGRPLPPPDTEADSRKP
jgi:hypothetical protein